MKNKKLAVIALTAIMLTGSIFAVVAKGQAENTTPGQPGYTNNYSGRPGWNNSRRPRYMMNYTLNKENEISVTGTIALNEDIHPVLKADGKEYELMVPRFLVYNSGLKDGDRISVTGYKLTTQTDSNEIELFVTKATINGKTYEIDEEMGKYMMGRRGMQHSRPGSRMNRGRYYYQQNNQPKS